MTYAQNRENPELAPLLALEAELNTASKQRQFWQHIMRFEQQSHSIDWTKWLTTKTLARHPTLSACSIYLLTELLPYIALTSHCQRINHLMLLDWLHEPGLNTSVLWHHVGSIHISSTTHIQNDIGVEYLFNMNNENIEDLSISVLSQDTLAWFFEQPQPTLKKIHLQNMLSIAQLGELPTWPNLEALFLRVDANIDATQEHHTRQYDWPNLEHLTLSLHNFTNAQTNLFAQHRMSPKTLTLDIKCCTTEVILNLLHKPNFQALESLTLTWSSVSDPDRIFEMDRCINQLKLPKLNALMLENADVVPNWSFDTPTLFGQLDWLTLSAQMLHQSPQLLAQLDALTCLSIISSPVSLLPDPEDVLDTNNKTPPQQTYLLNDDDAHNMSKAPLKLRFLEVRGSVMTMDGLIELAHAPWASTVQYLDIDEALTPVDDVDIFHQLRNKTAPNDALFGELRSLCAHEPKTLWHRLASFLITQATNTRFIEETMRYIEQALAQANITARPLPKIWHTISGHDAPAFFSLINTISLDSHTAKMWLGTPTLDQVTHIIAYHSCPKPDALVDLINAGKFNTVTHFKMAPSISFVHDLLFMLFSNAPALTHIDLDFYDYGGFRDRCLKHPQVARLTNIKCNRIHFNNFITALQNAHPTLALEHLSLRSGTNTDMTGFDSAHFPELRTLVLENATNLPHQCHLPNLTALRLIDQVDETYLQWSLPDDVHVQRT